MARLGNRLKRIEDAVDSPFGCKEVIVAPFKYQARTITYKGKAYNNDSTLEKELSADGYRNFVVCRIHERV